MTSRLPRTTRRSARVILATSTAGLILAGGTAAATADGPSPKPSDSSSETVTFEFPVTDGSAQKTAAEAQDRTVAFSVAIDAQERPAEDGADPSTATFPVRADDTSIVVTVTY